jgi:hypothetical protein
MRSGKNASIGTDSKISNNGKNILSVILLYVAMYARGIAHMSASIYALTKRSTVSPVA